MRRDLPVEVVLLRVVERLQLLLGNLDVHGFPGGHVDDLLEIWVGEADRV
jgi:hypothetical protein